MRLYFRINGNGAGIFRVDGENRQRRLQLAWIGRIDVTNDKLTLGKDVQLSAEEQAEIDAWTAKRRQVIETRHQARLAVAIEEMNAAAIWLGSKATDADIDAIGDELLLAIHDLRDAFVRRKSKRSSD